MSTQDIEVELDNIEAVLKNNLNTVISNINTEKADSITLRDIDANAYCFQSLNNEVFNYDPFILYGVVDINTDSIGHASSHEYKISVVLIAQDTTEGVDMDRRMFRYQRALTRVIENNWQKGFVGNTLKVESALPTTVEKLNGSEDFKVIGIEFNLTIA